MPRRSVSLASRQELPCDQASYPLKGTMHRREAMVSKWCSKLFSSRTYAGGKIHNECPLYRPSQKFRARAAHYRSLALTEPDAWCAEILFGISALFLEMATDMVDREMAISYSLAKRRTDIVHMTDGLWRDVTAAGPPSISRVSIFHRLLYRRPSTFLDLADRSKVPEPEVDTLPQF